MYSEYWETINWDDRLAIDFGLIPEYLAHFDKDHDRVLVSLGEYGPHIWMDRNTFKSIRDKHGSWYAAIPYVVRDLREGTSYANDQA